MKFKYLASAFDPQGFATPQNAIDSLFGRINPPPGVPTGNNALDAFLTLGVRLIFIAAGLTAFVYLMWGAFDWITSSGEKEKLNKAQNKLRNAIIGLLLLVVVLAGMTLMERAIFKCKVCFGISCPISFPTVNKPAAATSCR